MVPTAMTQKRRMVQIPWRLLILIGTPLGVMANVGDCGVMDCFAVWFMGPLNPDECALADSGCHYTVHVDRSNVFCTIIRCLPILLIGQG
jgi:hypothetical protein